MQLGIGSTDARKKKPEFFDLFGDIDKAAWEKYVDVELGPALVPGAIYIWDVSNEVCITWCITRPVHI